MICEKANEIGTKAYNLECLKEKRICIPKTAVITDSKCEYINSLKKDGKLLPEIIDILGEHNFFNFETEISYPIIVRSSSINEDTEEKSNAGKYISIYNCISRTELVDGVIRCWNSKKSDETMGVIIQEQILPYCSGVAFICETDGKIQLVIEGVIGLGELLVSGMVTPSAYMYNSSLDSFESIHKTSQKIAEFPIKDSNIVPTDDFMIRNHRFRVMNIGKNVCYALCDYTHDYWDQADEILRLIKNECFKIFDFFGASDIEWVYDENGNLYIVQRRPITRKLYFDRCSMKKKDSQENCFGGTTIVAGINSGKLISLSEYKGEDNVIVFAPMFLPRDILKVSNALGIISVECSLLSHCAILAREYGIPYWAGVDASLYEKFKGSNVEIDFGKKEIRIEENVKREQKQNMQEESIFINSTLNDPITTLGIDQEERKQYIMSEQARKVMAKYFDIDFINSKWGEI